MTSMTLRLFDSLYTALRERARREGRSIQAVANEAVARYVGDRDARLAEGLKLLLARDAELLDRLGKA